MSFRINCVQLLEEVILLVEVRVFIEVLILFSFALFSGICPQLLNTHKPSSVAAADVNRHLATAFWCKSSSADTVFKSGAHRERQKEIQERMRNRERKVAREGVQFGEFAVRLFHVNSLQKKNGSVGEVGVQLHAQITLCLTISSNYHVKFKEY